MENLSLEDGITLVSAFPGCLYSAGRQAKQYSGQKFNTVWNVVVKWLT